MATARLTDWLKPTYEAVYAERSRAIDQIRRDDSWDSLICYYRNGHYADFIEDWLFTYDPRRVNERLDPYVPFVLFPKQRELIDWMYVHFRNREGGIVEKSRDMGVSWVALAFALCVWLFEPGAKISVGSRKEDLVDDLGQPDSLFEKIRIMIRMLPIELIPQGYIEEDHATFCRIINPENQASITGEAGKNIGRGGRSTLYILDEAAFVENPDAVESALSQNTDVRFDVSTPNGMGNPFATRRFGGIIDVFTFHWRDDPRKDDAWYAKQCRFLDPRTLAQEIDLDYEASGEETVISSRWVRGSQALRRRLEKTPEWRAHVARWKAKGGVGGLDVSGGKSYSVFVPRFGPLVENTVHWKDDDTTNTAGKAQQAAGETGVNVIRYDTIGVGKGVMSALKRIAGKATQPVNVGKAPTNRLWPDGKSAEEKFSNLRAEIWWTMRDKLRKTYEYWMFLEGHGGQEYELDELMFLPDDASLAAELPRPGYSITESGKIQIEKKTRMEARGVRSPDHGDALSLTYAPPPAKARVGQTTGYF
jgi:phage terminase large subunit